MAAQEVPIYRVTFEDTFAVSGEIEHEYQVSVTWRPSARCTQQKWSYSIQLTAWQVNSQGHVEAVCSAYVAYPSRQHGSMPGAIIDGLYDLQDRLEAQRVLRTLPLNPGA